LYNDSSPNHRIYMRACAQMRNKEISKYVQINDKNPNLALTYPIRP